MSAFLLTLSTNNAAFQEDGDPTREVARILRKAADKIDDGETFGHLRDVNGNRVGFFTFNPAEEG